VQIPASSNAIPGVEFLQVRMHFSIPASSNALSSPELKFLQTTYICSPYTKEKEKTELLARLMKSGVFDSPPSERLPSPLALALCLS
jgi:hypothetical protein